MILRLGDGPALSQTMRATGMSNPTVWRWRDRFLEARVGGLLCDNHRRRGRKPKSEEKAGDCRLEGVRHPGAQRLEAPQGRDNQGLPRPEVRAEGPRRRGPLRRPARPRHRHPGGREGAVAGARADAAAPSAKWSSDTAPRSSSPYSTASPKGPSPEPRFTSFSTTSPPTSRSRSAGG